MWGRGGRVVRVALRAVVGPAMGILEIDRTGFSASPGAKGYFFCPKMGICGDNVRKYMYAIVHLLIITTTVYVQHPWPFLRLSHDFRTHKACAQEILRSAWPFPKEHVFVGMFFIKELTADRRLFKVSHYPLATIIDNLGRCSGC